VGVAVNVTDCPVQIVEVPVAIETDGTTAALTVIVTVLEVAVTGDAQVALEVIITVTTSELFNVEEVKVEEFVPTLPPFTCH
jgi:hypothetical protein